MPLDLLMPFYGDVGHLRIAVESVLAQQDGDWKLTVVDDCYPGDEHTAYLEQIEDPRVRLLRNERNLGVAGSFQRSLELATEERLAIIGGDDVLLPGYVGRMRALAERHPDVAMIQPGVQVVDDAGRPSLPLADRIKSWMRPAGGQVLSGERLAASLMQGNWAYFPSVVWRREVVAPLGFRQDLELALDLELMVRILLGGGGMLLDDEIVFAYRRHSGSASSPTSDLAPRFEQEHALFAELAARFDQAGWRRAAGAARAHVTSRLHAAALVPGLVARGDGAAAARMLRHAAAPAR